MHILINAEDSACNSGDDTDNFKNSFILRKKKVSISVAMWLPSTSASVMMMILRSKC